MKFTKLPKNLQTTMAKMGCKYPDSPWRLSSLTPAQKNQWVGGEYKYDDNLEPAFLNDETRTVKNTMEARSVYYSDRALGFSMAKLVKDMVRLKLRLI